MQLTAKVIDFLIAIKENGGKITKNEQKMYDSVRYYIMTGYLSSNGLIYCNGVNALNQKSWVLTEKGKRVSDLLYEIRSVLYNGKEKGKGNTARH